MTSLRFSLAGLALVFAAPGTSQTLVAPMSQVSLCVTTSIGTCGSICEPYDCIPNYTIANGGEMLELVIGGHPDTTYVLFMGTSPPGCQQVVGIQGMLSTWAPISVLDIGTTSVDPPGIGNPDALRGPCLAGLALVRLQLPQIVSPGLDLRFQVLGLNGPPSEPFLAFSRATELRLR